jgi:hypothetical protein
MQRRCFTQLALSSALVGAFGAGTSVSPVQAEAQAGSVQTVLELFTSQGCSSCPAADAMFEQFTKRQDTVALTYAVDYWDYLGWKDTLANPKFTQRQRSYAKARGDGQIYTPQIVVNGLAHTNGADARAIDKTLNLIGTKTTRWVPVKVGTDNGQVVVSAPAMEGPKTEVTVWVVTLAKRIDVAIKRGENAGKTLTYFNVVRDIMAVGMWNGEATSVRLDRAAVAHKGEDACAILLQAGMSGPIIGAAMLPTL